MFYEYNTELQQHEFLYKRNNITHCWSCIEITPNFVIKMISEVINHEKGIS